MNLEANIKALHPQAYRWSLTLCRGKAELAADVLQEVYLKMLEGKANYAGRSTFKTWLFSLIRNTASDHLRKEKTLLTTDADIECGVEEISVSENDETL